MLTEILKMILPVIAVIGLGVYCNRGKLFGGQGLEALKKVISNITLPVLLFNAFFSVNYNLRVLLIFVVIYCTCGLMLLAGYLLKRFVRPYQTYMPFLLSCFETGMLGYALYGVLVGTNNASTFAMIDVGQTMFAYTIFLSLMQAKEGHKPTVKSIVLNMLRKPPAVGMLLGILLGALGVGKIIFSSPIGGIYSDLTGFISAPTAFIILLVVGYEISFKKELLRPVFKTVVMRLLINAVLLVPVALILFSFIPYDENFMLALLVTFSLPAPFIIPLFADVKNDGEYISTTLSASTLVAIVLFIAIAVYSRI